MGFALSVLTNKFRRFMLDTYPELKRQYQPFPEGVCRIEIYGNTTITGLIEELPNSLILVWEEPASVNADDFVMRRVYNRKALFAVHELSASEREELGRKVAQRARKCARCGQSACNRSKKHPETSHPDSCGHKDTSIEYAHLLQDPANVVEGKLAGTKCGEWLTSKEREQSLAGSTVLGALVGPAIECPKCLRRDALEKRAATEGKSICDLEAEEGDSIPW